jgi:DNA-binding XRE family transcriptional regulator
MHDEHVKISQSSRAAVGGRTRICGLRDQLVTERHRRHFSQQHIADQIGVARSTISDFERCPEKSTSWIAFAYAHVFEFDVQFVCLSDEPISAENPNLEEIPLWGEVV